MNASRQSVRLLNEHMKEHMKEKPMKETEPVLLTSSQVHFIYASRFDRRSNMTDWHMEIQNRAFLVTVQKTTTGSG